MSKKNPLKSRKFWTAIITGAVDIAIALTPQLEPVRSELITGLTALAVAYILGTAGEDMAYWHGRK